MDPKERNQKIKERQKRLFRKDLAMNLLLLVPPILLTLIIVLFALFTFILSLLLIYFVLPMFYTVERRMRQSVTGIGKTNFTYADGYRAFFKDNMGGIFGVINALLTTFLLIIVLAFVLQYAFQPLTNCFPHGAESLSFLAEFLAEHNYNSFEILTNPDAIASLTYLTQPLTILVGVTAFLPMTYLLFYAIPMNLSNHQIATIVLPDIDKNLSAAQARTLSRIQFARGFQGYRLKNSIRLNWPYLLAFVLIYGLSLYGCSMIETTETMVMPIILLLSPTISLFFGFFLQYFWIGNDYCIIEESQDVLLESINPQIKFTIYQTYRNPNYIHGEESSARGCFVPEQTYQEKHPFSTPFEENHPETTFSPTTPPQSEGEEEKTDALRENPTGIVIDLSEDEEKKDKND